MQVNKYTFCGCTIEIRCPENITFEGNYSAFLDPTAQNSDYIIEVIRVKKLPEKTDNCAVLSEKYSVCTGITTRKFTAFFSSESKGYKDVSCLENESKLYINYSGEITDFLVFESIDLPQLLLQKGIGILHCSFVDYKGEAILFAGDKQVGKSTQASLWEKNLGATVVNGDRAGLYFKGKKALVGGVPYSGTSGICLNREMPIKAIICLSKGQENVVFAPDKFSSVMGLVGKFSYNCGDTAALDKVFSLVQDLCENTPVLNYSCLKEDSAVFYLKDILEKEF